MKAAFAASEQSVAVLVVGAGGTGMATALELARRGVRARIIDRSPAPIKSSRGIGIHPRTLELLRLHGLADAFAEVGLPQSGLYFYEGGQQIASVDFTSAPSCYQTIAVPQAESERIFRSAVQRAGLMVEWGTELLGAANTAGGVVARLRRQDGSEENIETEWVVGCDGARSTVRGLIGASFDGDSYPEAWGLVDCDVQWDMPTDGVRVYRDPQGKQLVVIPIGGDKYRLQIDQRAEPVATEPPTLEEMQHELQQRTGLNATISKIQWASSYRLHRRIADRYRKGRIFIAGDAAHIHSPYGAQGLNTGIQDGINIGWKLGLVVTRHAAPSLLDSYESERRPIATEVIELSHALLQHTQDIAGSPKRRKALSAIVSGCAASYRDGPLSRQGQDWPREALRPGDRVPDFSFEHDKDGEISLYELLTPGLPTLALLTGDCTQADTAHLASVIGGHWSKSLRIFVVDERGAADAASLPLRITDKEGDFRRMLGLSGSRATAVVIRPDAYFGFMACGNLPEEVDAYLAEALRLVPSAGHHSTFPRSLSPV